jgi:hypothetical protein
MKSHRRATIFEQLEFVSQIIPKPVFVDRRKVGLSRLKGLRPTFRCPPSTHASGGGTGREEIECPVEEVKRLEQASV